jgi:hypothetical protein
MKKLFLVTLIIAATALAGMAQKTVNEYFLAIPEEYFKADVRDRAFWIDNTDEKDGFLEFTIPAAKFLDEYVEGANVFGNAQLFRHDNGGVIIGISINLCIEKSCQGQVIFLKNKNKQWEDVTEKLSPSIDNNEIYRILKDSPAMEKRVKKGEEIPLAIEFNGEEKSIRYIAQCKKNCDGGVVAKMFKWNGISFEEFEYDVSP